MYSGRKLYEEAKIPHRYFLEQAVDFDRFAKLPAKTPADIAAIPRPVFGYIGSSDWYTMDAPLIEQVTKLRPDWHWAFIGGKSNALQLSGPNLHFLGVEALRRAGCVLSSHRCVRFTLESAKRIHELRECHQGEGVPRYRDTGGNFTFYEYLIPPGM